MLDNKYAIENLWVKKKWSVMVFLAGGCDISDEARESLLKMKQAGSTDDIHVIAQFDSGSEGTVTKRYYLTPSENASEVLMLLEQACAEVPDSLEPYDDAAWMFYHKSLCKALSYNQRVVFDAMPSEEMKNLLISSPDRFRNFVLNCMLDGDVYPRTSGNVGDTNAGDPQVLVDFIRWAKVRYPAEHYLVVLWGHGSGLSVAMDFPSWPNIGPGDSLTAHELLTAFEEATKNLKEKFADETRKFILEEYINQNIDFIEKLPNWDWKNKGIKGIMKALVKLIKDSTETDAIKSLKKIKETLDTLDNEGLGAELGHEPKVDIVGFNSCSLATIEVYRQLDKYVDLVIASEGFTPKSSWPYDRILKALDTDCKNANATRIEPVGLAKTIVKEYISYYREPIKVAVKLKELQRRAIELGIDVDPIYGLDLKYKGPGMKYKGPGMKYKGPGMKYKGPGMASDGELLEIGGVDLSVCKPKESKKVATCMSILVEKLASLQGNPAREKAAFGAVLGAHAVSQSYFNGNFTDLHDFCRALRDFFPINPSEKPIPFNKVKFGSLKVEAPHTGIPLKRIKKPLPLASISAGSICEWVMEAVQQMNALKNEKIENSFGDDVRNSNGVSIFFPWGKWAEKEFAVPYKKLTFLTETKWHEFLDSYRKWAADFEKKEGVFKESGES